MEGNRDHRSRRRHRRRSRDRDRERDDRGGRRDRRHRGGAGGAGDDSRESDDRDGELPALRRPSDPSTPANTPKSDNSDSSAPSMEKRVERAVVRRVAGVAASAQAADTGGARGTVWVEARWPAASRLVDCNFTRLPEALAGVAVQGEGVAIAGAPTAAGASFRSVGSAYSTDASDGAAMGATGAATGSEGATAVEADARALSRMLAAAASGASSLRDHHAHVLDALAALVRDNPRLDLVPAIQPAIDVALSTLSAGDALSVAATRLLCVLPATGLAVVRTALQNCSDGLRGDTSTRRELVSVLARLLVPLAWSPSEDESAVTGPTAAAARLLVWGRCKADKDLVEAKGDDVSEATAVVRSFRATAELKAVVSSLAALRCGVDDGAASLGGTARIGFLDAAARLLGKTVGDPGTLRKHVDEDGLPMDVVFPALPEVDAEKLEVGHPVRARYRGGSWFDGQIAAINEESDDDDEVTYNITYDDGDRESGVPAENIEHRDGTPIGRPDKSMLRRRERAAQRRAELLTALDATPHTTVAVAIVRCIVRELLISADYIGSTAPGGAGGGWRSAEGATVAEVAAVMSNFEPWRHAIALAFVERSLATYSLNICAARTLGTLDAAFIARLSSLVEDMGRTAVQLRLPAKTAHELQDTHISTVRADVTILLSQLKGSSRSHSLEHALERFIDAAMAGDGFSEVELRLQSVTSLAAEFLDGAALDALTASWKAAVSAVAKKLLLALVVSTEPAERAVARLHGAARTVASLGRARLFPRWPRGEAATCEAFAAVATQLPRATAFEVAERLALCVQHSLKRRAGTAASATASDFGSTRMSSIGLPCLSPQPPSFCLEVAELCSLLQCTTDVASVHAHLLKDRLLRFRVRSIAAELEAVYWMERACATSTRSDAPPDALRSCVALLRQFAAASRTNATFTDEAPPSSDVHIREAVYTVVLSPSSWATLGLPRASALPCVPAELKAECKAFAAWFGSLSGGGHSLVTGRSPVTTLTWALHAGSALVVWHREGVEPVQLEVSTLQMCVLSMFNEVPALRFSDLAVKLRAAPDRSADAAASDAARTNAHMLAQALIELTSPGQDVLRADALPDGSGLFGRDVIFSVNTSFSVTPSGTGSGKRVIIHRVSRELSQPAVDAASTPAPRSRSRTDDSTVLRSLKAERRAVVGWRRELVDACIVRALKHAPRPLALDDLVSTVRARCAPFFAIAPDDVPRRVAHLAARKIVAASRQMPEDTESASVVCVSYLRGPGEPCSPSSVQREESKGGVVEERESKDGDPNLVIPASETAPERGISISSALSTSLVSVASTSSGLGEPPGLPPRHRATSDTVPPPPPPTGDDIPKLQRATSVEERFERAGRYQLPMRATDRSSAQMLQRALRKNVDRIAIAGKVRRGIALRFLLRCEFDTYEALDRLFDEPAQLMRECGFRLPDGVSDADAMSLLRTQSAAKPLRAGAQSDTAECPVCMDDVTGSQLFTIVECGHSFCRTCVVDHVRELISRGQLSPRCPMADCTVCLDRDGLAAIDDAGTETAGLVNLLESVASAQMVSTSPTLAKCGSSECDAIVQWHSMAPEVTCLKCDSSFCTRCPFPPHRPASCAQIRIWHDRGGYALGLSEQERASLALILKDSMRCFRCGFLVHRYAACVHMTCKVSATATTQPPTGLMHVIASAPGALQNDGCGAEFCAVCGRVCKLHRS